jgi:hypothetical protein
MRSAELHSPEMFIPLTHAPGGAQADFGEVLGVIISVEQKTHYLAVDLPHSNDCFVVAFRTETTPRSWKAMYELLVYFEAVPSGILYATRRSRLLGFWAATRILATVVPRLRTTVASRNRSDWTLTKRVSKPHELFGRTEMADSNVLKRCYTRLEKAMPPTIYRSPPPRPAEIHTQGRTLQSPSSCHSLFERWSAEAQPAF